MTTPEKRPKAGVFKLAYSGKLYYKFGYGVEDAWVRLARELRVKPEAIEILEGGKPQ